MFPPVAAQVKVTFPPGTHGDCIAVPAALCMEVYENSQGDSQPERDRPKRGSTPQRDSTLGLGIVWFFFDTDAKSILLKRYRCLNGA